MYCSNCGQVMNDGAAICTNCGFARGNGVHFCENCGAERNPGASMCVKCGFALGQGASGASKKTKTIAGLLYIILGAFGIGDFYLGYTTKGIIKLLLSLFTFLLSRFIWIFIVGALIVWIISIVEGVKCLQGGMKDAKGIPLKDE